MRLHPKGLGKKMEHQTELIEYLKIKLETIQGKIKNNKQMFEEYGKEILEMKNRISDLEHKIDFAYEAFSPISVQQQVIQAETDRLKEEVEEKQKERDEIQKETAELRKEEEQVKIFLSEGYFLCKEEKREEKRETEKGSILLEQQEMERQRIARELHDTTVQDLTALIHKIDFCTQILDSDPIRVRLELEVMNQIVRDSVKGMREIIYSLRPMAFDDIGFYDTIVQEVQRLQKGFDTKIVLEVTGEEYPVSQVIQLTILRIIQEAVNNCKKHANAKMIDITLSYQKEKIELDIMDDGVGFDTKLVPAKNEKNVSFGLSMMRERICLLNGTFAIESKVGFGTEIQVIIPAKKEAEKKENTNE